MQGGDTTVEYNSTSTIQYNHNLMPYSMPRFCFKDCVSQPPETYLYFLLLFSYRQDSFCVTAFLLRVSVKLSSVLPSSQVSTQRSADFH